LEPAPDPAYFSQGINNFAIHRGNERRNNLVGPGINNWDMSLNKAFKVFGEGRELQFRAESFNTFNHTQWSSISAPGTNYVFDDRQTNPASTFGWVTGARPGRHMQVALKFVF
jgi:hypothetical protein